VESAWDDEIATALGEDPLALRVYSSRLLGGEPTLVLHGGGNTSVKATVSDFFGAAVDVLYVKGSGWDLATIEAPGFSPVRLRVLEAMARMERLSDPEMVREQRAAMLDPDAPNPSVEAILHAIIPGRFVDHTHADAVVAISNTPDGTERLRRLYGPNVWLIPYVMPGFELARAIVEQTRDRDWATCEGMILEHHGVFTWGESAKQSYERMIDLVAKAEAYLSDEAGAVDEAADPRAKGADTYDPMVLARLRRAVSRAEGRPVIARIDRAAAARAFVSRPNADALATRGPATPDHVIRTKRVAMVVGDDVDADVRAFGERYAEYFAAHDDGSRTALPGAPRWAIWPGAGVVALGPSSKLADQVADIVRHTQRCIAWSEAMGGWTPLPADDIFRMEYWDLEQAKLRRGGNPPPWQGRIALRSGGDPDVQRSARPRVGV
jgi:rhamnose utilization protein RhaD (predicted bifunctional aldolase and dehydrogenase)